MKKVSVIVPVYNVEKYLPKCLDSLVHQTLEEIEIIVVNDGSPDNSREIIDDYAARYPDKIRAFHRENSGVSAARNFGVEQARGKYLGFVDSDDFADLDMYERLYKKAHADGADVVASPLTYERTGKTTKKQFDESIFGVSVRENPEILRWANTYVHNKLFRRSFWVKNGFTFPLEQRYEDVALIYNVLMAANKVDCVNIPFMHYLRDREGSACNEFKMHTFDVFKSVDSIVSYAKKLEYYDRLRQEIQYICLRHLMVRIPVVRECPDTAVSRRFVRQMFRILNRYFPDWRKNDYVKDSPEDSVKKQIMQKIRRSEFLMTLYVTRPEAMDAFIEWYIQKDAEGSPLWRMFVNRNQNPAEETDADPEGEEEMTETEKEESKLFYFRKNGLKVFCKAQKQLKKAGMDGFAAFDTCRGLVRDQKIPETDLCIHMGVVADSVERSRARIALERNGFKLRRQYFWQEQPVREIYRHKRVKVALNYYEMTDTGSWTWQFYRKPEHEYEVSRVRHVVGISGPPIRGVTCVEVDGKQLAVPEGAETFLEEIYGPEWKTSGTEWNCWESPAAVRQEQMGAYKVVQYV